MTGERTERECTPNQQLSTGPYGNGEMGAKVTWGLMVALAALLIASVGVSAAKTKKSDRSARQKGPTLPEGIETMVVIKGTCRKFELGSRSATCDSVIYAVLSNGRITFNFPTESGSIMLSGTKDSQLDPEHYTLQIDRIRAGSSKENTAYESKGKCEMVVSEDGSLVRSITCDATNDVEAVSVVFQGGKSPVQRFSK